MAGIRDPRQIGVFAETDPPATGSHAATCPNAHGAILRAQDHADSEEAAHACRHGRPRGESQSILRMLAMRWRSATGSHAAPRPNAHGAIARESPLRRLGLVR